MAKLDCGIKRNSTIAVFEHVVEKKKEQKPKRFRTNRFLDDDSPSESELVIDEKPARKKKSDAIKLSEESLTLICQWENCEEVFTDYQKFQKHLMFHCSEFFKVHKQDIADCQWNDCAHKQLAKAYFTQHMSYHGYISKLKNIGNNELSRTSLPDCKKIIADDEIPIKYNWYMCEYEDCDNQFETIFEFHNHIIAHVKANPRVASNDEIIKCYWKGCNNKFPNQYKLAEHLRVHTKEKILACPTCLKQFSTKTKFRDHRKRQLSTDLQSYQCSQCLKLFATERLLRDHMRSHINHYKCTMCDMTCPKPSNLATHIRLKHIKAKPFKCVTCDKSFFFKTNLRQHILTHNNSSYSCNECDFKCKSAYAFKRHCAKHKQKVAVYECHNCKDKFNRGGHLTKHLMKKHNYHWPSGHTRFRYRQDQDGIYRLQTVRYESLEVTEEMIRSETMQSSSIPQSTSYKIQYEENNETIVMSVAATDIEPVDTDADTTNRTSNSVLITIQDVDEHGNVLKSETIESSEIFLNDEIKKSLRNKSKSKWNGEVKEIIKKGANKKQKVKKMKSSGTVKKDKDEENTKKCQVTNDIHYFSEDIILNSDIFNITSTTNSQ